MLSGSSLEPMSITGKFCCSVGFTYILLKSSIISKDEWTVRLFLFFSANFMLGELVVNLDSRGTSMFWTVGICNFTGNVGVDFFKSILVFSSSSEELAPSRYLLRVFGYKDSELVVIS